MTTHYNRIAGQNLERLAALSDGIFAVAMTLLVLDLHVPINRVSDEYPLWTSNTLHIEEEVLHLLGTLSPSLITYFMSFLTLGIFWVAQQTQLNHFSQSDRNLTWIHLGFLLVVTLTPFSTGLLAARIASRLALIFYWLNILLLGIFLFSSIRYAKRAQLVKDKLALEMRYTHESRILMAQAFYACAMLFSIFSTYLSIVLIVLVQLNFVLAPRIPLFKNLTNPPEAGFFSRLGRYWRREDEHRTIDE